jgi:hypothetical protein
MKFCALTATPMYNTYKEIIFLFNLLLKNDKKPEIRQQDVFDVNGNITENGETGKNTLISNVSNKVRLKTKQ